MLVTVSILIVTLTVAGVSQPDATATILIGNIDTLDSTFLEEL